MYNCTTSSKYFSLQNPHNNPAIVVVLNKKIFQICSTLIFQNSDLYLSRPLEQMIRLVIKNRDYFFLMRLKVDWVIPR